MSRSIQGDEDDWIRGFLAGVAFAETNTYQKPLEMQERAREYRENVPMLLDDVWIPAGLGFAQGWITPLEHERNTLSLSTDTDRSRGDR